jgi:hypothetical protein
VVERNGALGKSAVGMNEDVEARFLLPRFNERVVDPSERAGRMGIGVRRAQKGRDVPRRLWRDLS